MTLSERVRCVWRELPAVGERIGDRNGPCASKGDRLEASTPGTTHSDIYLGEEFATMLRNAACSSVRL